MTLEVAATSVRTEYEQFLDEHPAVRFIDAVTIDLCGIFRGKRYPRDDLAKLYRSGLALPYTVYLMDVTGDSCDPGGRGFTDGDPDGICLPVPGTLVPVPWIDESRAQVLTTMTEPDGTPSLIDPRNVAAHVLKRFEPLGLKPVLAFELEFYLLDQERDSAGRPQAPVSPLTGKRESATQVYGITELDGFSAFFADVERTARVQNIPVGVASSEFAPGQYEVNLHHVSDPLVAADHCALLRNLVKRVATKHGMQATFMAKPFLELSGSGMHIHLSLLDRAGNNVFDGGAADASATLHYAIGGMMEMMADSSGIFSSHANAYRRLSPNMYVPVARSWAVNNRSVAFRIPVSDGSNRRVENRVAAADANPYLVLASVLAGVHHGIVNKVDPGAPSEGNACDVCDPELPRTWAQGLDATQSSKLLREYLTAECIDLYCETKRGEMQAFDAFISMREYDWYL